MSENFTQLCRDLEHYETPEWAAKAILEKEILTYTVLDPCCGVGILSEAADKFYDVVSKDIHDWGYIHQHNTDDFLSDIFLLPTGFSWENFTVFMNPPFSLADKFVEKSFELGARKIVCFQRFSWWEGAYDKGKKRGQWWEKYRPNRVYICGNRATCWRHDIPASGRGSSTPIAHAWFVWEKGHPPGTLLGHIYKGTG